MPPTPTSRRMDNITADNLLPRRSAGDASRPEGSAAQADARRDRRRLRRYRHLAALRDEGKLPRPAPAGGRPLHIFGVLSLIFWSLMLVVTVKYVLVAMRADNKGEGGSFALLSLISRNLGGKKWTPALVMLGVLATCLFYGDAMITPAISVLSAVEGLTVVEAGLAAARHPDRDRHPDRPVPRPVARDGQGRRDVRAGHPRLFRRARGARRHRTSSRIPRSSARSARIGRSSSSSTTRSSPSSRWARCSSR